MPFDLGLPVWSDDPHFHLDHHLRRAALPGRGDSTMADLEIWVGDLMSRPLDRGRPLWEIWMVDGLRHGRWAVVAKVHHCMVDGVSGSDLLGLILDVSPEPDEVALPRWKASAAPLRGSSPRQGCPG